MDRTGGNANAVWIFGPVNMDVMARPADPEKLSAASLPMEAVQISFGGDALNEAVVLHRLGADVRLISKVGQDDAGDQILRFLEKEGLSTAGILRRPEVPTSINIVLVDSRGERRFLTDPRGAMRHMTESDYEPWLEEASGIVCFPGMFVSPALDIPAMERLFARIRQKPGVVLAADMTRAKNGETLRDLRNVLPHLDFIFPNEEEIALLTGDPDPRTNARLLVEAGVRCAVIKRGGKGCLLAAGSRILELPAYPAAKAVDTTGAGDAFTAGFLYALSRGMDLPDCGRFANAAASCIVEVFGANQGIRSAEEPMRRFLAT